MTVFFDQHNTRFKQVHSNDSSVDWLFIPGGPGCDSSCFDNLIENINLPGNVWYVDFAENGSNYTGEYDSNFDFSKWSDAIIDAVKRFDNPILVGHSFGGVFTLLHEKLENHIRGLVLIGSQPTYDEKVLDDYAKSHGLDYDKSARITFKKEINDQNFRDVLLAKSHYHFPENTLSKGQEMFRGIAFNYLAPLWWSLKVKSTTPRVTWVPNIPCLILNGDKDYIAPLHIFKEDKRFRKENIKMHSIENAGHYPWYEASKKIENHLNNFISSISN